MRTGCRRDPMVEMDKDDTSWKIVLGKRLFTYRIATAKSTATKSILNSKKGMIDNIKYFVEILKTFINRASFPAEEWQIDALVLYPTT